MDGSGDEAAACESELFYSSDVIQILMANGEDTSNYSKPVAAEASLVKQRWLIYNSKGNIRQDSGLL